MNNEEIKEELKKYGLTYANILPYLGFKHTTRISEELALELSEERQKEYLLAIKKAKEKKKNELKNLLDLYNN